MTTSAANSSHDGVPLRSNAFCVEMASIKTHHPIRKFHDCRWSDTAGYR
jgi:hypothetical protein